MFKMRPSSLGLIMTEPKAKTETLSVGAKTYIKSCAKEFVYGFTENVTCKYMEKGNLVENESIALYNRVFGTSHVKNTVRIENDYLTGECDINAPDEIIDIKSSWSLGTFPAFSEDAKKSDYEWQVRAYMILYNKHKAKVAHCMVSTPEHLVKYEQFDMHFVDGIEERLRVTVVNYERDLELDKKIEEKCKAAQIYFKEMVEAIANEHKQLKYNLHY